MEPTKERELVEQAKLDPANFAGLYDHYYPHIRRFFSVKLNKKDLVDDLTSTTFEKAIKNIDKFKWQGYPFSAWLYRIASNTLTDYFRKAGRSKSIPMPDFIDAASETRSPEEETEIAFETSALEQVLGELKDRERKIIYMKFFDGYSNKVIAERLSISESNVGTIVHRGLQKLKQLLS